MVVFWSVLSRLRVFFGVLRVREQKYTAGQIDARWSDPIEQDFTGWLGENREKLPVAKEQVDEIIRERTR
jgi:hypothetical protein